MILAVYPLLSRSTKHVVKNNETPFLANIDDTVELVALVVQLFEDQPHDLMWNVQNGSRGRHNRVNDCHDGYILFFLGQSAKQNIRLTPGNT